MWVTGYFAVPGKKDTGTKVHFVDDGKPICQAPIRKGAELFENALGFQFRLVECQRCRNIANSSTGRYPRVSPYE